MGSDSDKQVPSLCPCLILLFLSVSFRTADLPPQETPPRVWVLLYVSGSPLASLMIPSLSPVYVDSCHHVDRGLFLGPFVCSLPLHRHLWLTLSSLRMPLKSLHPAIIRLSPRLSFSIHSSLYPLECLTQPLGTHELPPKPVPLPGLLAPSWNLLHLLGPTSRLLPSQSCSSISLPPLTPTPSLLSPSLT